MPELPEVETVARELKPLVKNKILKSISILDNKIKLPKLRNKKVLDVYRFGKEVVFEFDKSFIAIHLRMTGRLLELGKEQKNKSIYYHEHSFKIAFVDVRRFGTVKLLKELIPTGLDPVKKDFTYEVFCELIKSTSQPLKNFLMRQDKITGIGNIYASEILFLSKLSPLRDTRSLNQKEYKVLYRNIIKILNKAIDNCGTTFSDFQTTTGDTGNYQKFLKVYQREDLKCVRCKAKIRRIMQQQRSTFYCVKCQK